MDLHTYERTNQCDMLQFGILPGWQLFETLTIVILRRGDRLKNRPIWAACCQMSSAFRQTRLHDFYKQLRRGSHTLDSGLLFHLLCKQVSQPFIRVSLENALIPQTKNGPL